jgi:hypothetical protein
VNKHLTELEYLPPPHVDMSSLNGDFTVGLFVRLEMKDGHIYSPGHSCSRYSSSNVRLNACSEWPCCQELGKAHAVVARGSDLARDINAALPNAYSQLAAAAAAGGPERDAAATILDGARWLWTGSGFTSSADVAVDCPGDLR